MKKIADIVNGDQPDTNDESQFLKRGLELAKQAPERRKAREKAEKDRRGAFDRVQADLDRAMMRRHAMTRAGFVDEEALERICEVPGIPVPPGGEHEASRRACELALEVVRTEAGRPVSPLRSLAILGPTGIGKTFAGAVALSRWPHRAMFLQAVQIKKSPTWYDLAVEAARVPLLVVNDIAPDNRFQCDALDEVLTARWDAGRRTIFTANFHPTRALRERTNPGGVGQSIEEALGARAMSRFGWDRRWYVDPADPSDPKGKRLAQPERPKWAKGWTLLLNGDDLRSRGMG